MGRKKEEHVYDSEPELHRIFDMMLERFDRDPVADLTPRIEHVDKFLVLHRLQNSPIWLHFYDIEPWQLMRFLLSGSEKAFGLDPLTAEPSPEEVTSTLETMLEMLRGKAEFKEEHLSEHNQLRAVQLFLANRCLAVGYVCLLQYMETIISIIDQAMRGDEGAFLDLVKLDAAFLYSPYGQRIVLEAELRNDAQFKCSLADVLEPDPKFWSREGKRNQYIFLTLAMLSDYIYRDDDAWAEFFSYHDLPSYRDPNNVRMQRKRYNLTQLPRE